MQRAKRDPSFLRGIKCYTCHKADEVDEEFGPLEVEAPPHEANCCVELCKHRANCKIASHYHRKKKALDGFKRREEEAKAKSDKRKVATHVRAKLCDVKLASECPDGAEHHHPIEGGGDLDPAMEESQIIKEAMAEYTVDKEDRERIGTAIYGKVAKLVPELAGKITGMLLERPLVELDTYVEDSSAMGAVVMEALDLLKDYDPGLEMVEIRREAANSVVDMTVLDKVEFFLEDSEFQSGRRDHEVAECTLDPAIVKTVEEFVTKTEQPKPVVVEPIGAREDAYPGLGFTQTQRWARTSTLCGEFDGIVNAMNILKTPQDGDNFFPLNGRLTIPCLQETQKTLLGKSVIRDRLAAYPTWEAPASQQSDDKTVDKGPPRDPTAPLEGAEKKAPAKSDLFCTSTVTLYFASDRGESRNPFVRIFSAALSYLPYVQVEKQMVPLDPVGRATVENHTSVQLVGVKKGVTFGRVGNHNASYWLEQDKSSLYDVEYLDKYGYTTCERVVIFDDYYKFLMDDSRLVNVKVLTAKGAPREHVIGQLQNLSLGYKNLDEMNTRSRQTVQNTVMFAYQQKLVIETKSIQVVPRGVGGPPLNGR